MKLKILGVFSILLIIFLSIYALDESKKTQLKNYLPELSNYDLREVKIEKITADPSYRIPYTILISFETDSNNVFENLGMKEKGAIDMELLESNSSIDERRLYFTMRSINGIRYNSIQEKVNQTNWWRENSKELIYASSYLEQDRKVSIIPFNTIKNGRIVGFKNNVSYFIMIECWG